jgi:DNA-binding transcriptional LysR family regulator
MANDIGEILFGRTEAVQVQDWRQFARSEHGGDLEVNILYAHRQRFSCKLADQDFVMFSRQVSPVYFDSLVASCRSNGFSPRILHEVCSVASQVAFVGCGQGIALVPASLKKLAPENVVFRPLKENVSVVTTAVAWRTGRDNPLIDAVVAVLGTTGGGSKMRKALR